VERQRFFDLQNAEMRLSLYEGFNNLIWRVFALPRTEWVVLQPRWPRSGSQARFDAAPPRRQGQKILCRARWWSSRVVQPDMELERPLAQQVPN
jgi:hypothetical protein